MQLVRHYRTGLPPKCCIVCKHKILNNKQKESHYFCTVNCYTRFRTGLGVDYSKLVCAFPKDDNEFITTIIDNNNSNNNNKEPRPGFVDYKVFNFCRGCRLKLDKILYPKRCPRCGFRVSTKKRNKLRKSADRKIIIDDRIRVA